MPHDHDGHRDRMRKRFLQGGLDGFAPHEVLELLLFYAIPRRDVNPLAHRLVKHFGSASAVLEARQDQLVQVEGIGQTAASLIAMVLPLARYAEREQMGERVMITNYREAKTFCQHLFAGKADEVLYVICLDAQGRVIRAVPAIEGTIDEIPIYPRTVVETALLHHAYSVVLAHNHPSGVSEPSPADVETTDLLRAALGTVDIRLQDHVVYAEGVCTSIAQWVRRGQVTPMPTREMSRAADTKLATKQNGKEGK